MRVKLILVLLLQVHFLFAQVEKKIVAAVENNVSGKPSVNTVSDGVKQWIINDAYGSMPVTKGEYGQGSLTKKIVVDANGASTVEFTDKNGNVILQKIQVGEKTTNAHEGWLCTYFIYDGQSRLRFVMQPNAVEWLANNNWSIAENEGKKVASEWCFQYEYGNKNRLKIQKNPGAAEIYTVYDKMNRAVFIQDGNMRKKQEWMATMYDELDRPVVMGMMKYQGSVDELQDYADGNIKSGYVKNDALYYDESFANEKDILLQTKQAESKLYQASNSIVMEDGFNSDISPSLVMEIEKSNSRHSGEGVARVTENPVPPGIDITLLKVVYYGNYNFLSESNHGFAFKPGNTKVADGQIADDANGEITGMKVRVLGNPENLVNSEWLTSVNYYDNIGRLVQAQSENFKGGKDISTNIYNAEGKLISNYLSHNNPQTTDAHLRTLAIKTDMEYTSGGSLQSVYKTINDDAGTKKLVLKNEYNENGLLAKKELGATSASNTPIAVMEYAYDESGKVKGINWAYEKNKSYPDVNIDNNRWFGMDVSGMNNYGQALEESWQSGSDMAQRKYGFQYDNAHRLMLADFNQKFGDNWAKSEPGSSGFNIDFSCKIGNGSNAFSAYDGNSNIKGLQQWGLKINRSTVFDQLSFNYYPVSNSLQSVADGSNVKAGASSITEPAAFVYDANGNLAADKGNSGELQTIEYNCLNLPWKITVKDKGIIYYSYDANGNKLQKKVEIFPNRKEEKGKVDITDFAAGFVYQNNKLDYIKYDNGRVRPVVQANNLKFNYDYFLKDNDGDVRMVLTDEERIDAYPVASMENGKEKVENAVYSNIDASRDRLPAGYPSDTYTSPNNSVARLNGSGNKIGPSIMLKVMAGDQFNIRASSWYRTNNVQQGKPVNILDDMVAAMTGGLGSVNKEGIAFDNSQVLLPGVTDFLKEHDNTNVNKKPRAFVNWVLFDGQFKFVAASSGFEQVGGEGEFKVHVKNNIRVAKSGYLYVFVSNETPNQDVYFDNLQLTHIRGPLLQENHYYPFGSIMKGISYTAAGFTGNNYKFRSAEYNNDFDIGFYETSVGLYNPRLGKFWQSKFTPSVIFAIGNGKIGLQGIVLPQSLMGLKNIPVKF